jgi:hypothetical protein
VADVYGLTPQEVMVLRGALAKIDKIAPQAPKSLGLGAGFVSRPDDMPSPEVYVARTRSGGIPALSEGGDTGTGTGSSLLDDGPGSAICDIYSTQETSPGNFYLRPINGLSKRVFNLSGSAVAGHEWVVVTRTKGGFWYVVNRESTAGNTRLHEDFGSGYAITSTTYADITGVEITLPSSGIYVLTANFFTQGSASAVGGTAPYVAAKLWDNTNSAYIDPDTDTITISVPVASKVMYQSACIATTVQVTGSTVIRVRAKQDSTGSTWTFAYPSITYITLDAIKVSN